VKQEGRYEKGISGAGEIADRESPTSDLEFEISTAPSIS
jgi:hypothetical protein